MGNQTSNYGTCYECSAGTVGNEGSGFEQYIDGEEPSWFCRYCGSYLVEVKDKNGNVIAGQIKEEL